MANKRKRVSKTSSGARKNRAGKNCKRRSGALGSAVDKYTRHCLGRGQHDFEFTEKQKQDLWEFHERDRRDRKARMDRLKRSDLMAQKKKDQPDIMRVPLLEVALHSFDQAQIIQTLLIAAALKYENRRFFPFFILKRTAKLGNRPITII